MAKKSQAPVVHRSATRWTSIFDMRDPASWRAVLTYNLWGLVPILAKHRGNSERYFYDAGWTYRDLINVFRTEHAELPEADRAKGDLIIFDSKGMAASVRQAGKSVTISAMAGTEEKDWTEWPDLGLLDLRASPKPPDDPIFSVDTLADGSLRISRRTVPLAETKDNPPQAIDHVELVHAINRLKETMEAQAPGATPAPKAESGKDTENPALGEEGKANGNRIEGWYSETALIQKYAIPSQKQGTFKRRLREHRKKNPWSQDVRTPGENRKPRDPIFLYRESAFLGVIEEVTR